MKIKFVYFIQLVLILLVVTNGIVAQTNVSVSATIHKKRILIGEPIQVTLEAKAPSNAAMAWFPIDSIPHFEFIEKGRIDSVLDNGEKSMRQDIVVTSFDSGTWVMPAMPLVVNGTTYLTDSAVIEVGYSKIDPNQDYHDIKDIVDIPDPYAKYIPWAVAGITLVSLVGLIYFVQYKKLTKQEMIAQAALRLSPYEEAKQALEELKKQRLGPDGSVKWYYTRLNDILRQFLLRQLQIASMVKTNDEIIFQLRQLNISRDEFSQLAQALRMSDFVKFAKYQPSSVENEQNFSIISSSVELLNNIEK